MTAILTNKWKGLIPAGSNTLRIHTSCRAILTIVEFIGTLSPSLDVTGISMGASSITSNRISYPKAIEPTTLIVISSKKQSTEERAQQDLANWMIHWECAYKTSAYGWWHAARLHRLRQTSKMAIHKLDERNRCVLASSTRSWTKHNHEPDTKGTNQTPQSVEIWALSHCSSKATRWISIWLSCTPCRSTENKWALRISDSKRVQI